MPAKSHPSTSSTTRKQRTIVKDQIEKAHSHYTNLGDVATKINKLKSLSEWEIEMNEEQITLKKFSKIHDVSIPYITIILDDGQLKFFIGSFQKTIVCTWQIKDHSKTLQYTT